MTHPSARAERAKRRPVASSETAEFEQAARELVHFIYKGMKGAHALRDARSHVGKWLIDELETRGLMPPHWLEPHHLTEMRRSDCLARPGLIARNVLIENWRELTERQQAKEARAAEREGRLRWLMDQIEKAKPYLNEGTLERNPTDWPPASRLKIMLLMSKSGEDNMPHKLPGYFEGFCGEVEERLAVARQRYRDGFYADPFGEPVRRVS